MNAHTKIIYLYWSLARSLQDVWLRSDSTLRLLTVLPGFSNGPNMLLTEHAAQVLALVVLLENVFLHAVSAFKVT